MPVSVVKPRRVLSEDEYTAIHDRLLSEAPAGMDEASFQRWMGSRFDGAIAEAEQNPEEIKGSGWGRFWSNAGEMLNPVAAVKGIYGALSSPGRPEDAFLGPLAGAAGLIRGAVGSQVGEGQRALDLAKGGRYVEAAGHGLAALTPLVGPAAAAAGEQIAEGDVAGGLGKGAGLLAPMALGAALPKSVKAPAIAPSVPEAAEALALAEREGIPLDAATATGNRFVKAAQHVSDRSLGGSLVAGKAAQAQAEGLATLGEQLAAKGYATPVSAEQAGEAVRSGIQSQITGNADLANDAYRILRKIEADPANARPVPMPDGSTALMPLPVSIGPVKAAIKPIYESLLREKELNGVMMGDKARALTALDTLMAAPEHAPLSVVDAALGDLKSFARADDPALRTIGQGKVAMAVAKLHQAVDGAAAQAGPQAQAALREGRTATTAKYGAADVLDSLHVEPVRTMKALTAAGDTAIDKLRAVAAQAPNVLPQIGRAKIGELLEMAPDKRFAEWRKLGTATKQMLYQDPGYVNDLDAFMRLAKMTAETSNPSGTAHTLIAAGQGGLLLTNPIAGAATLIGTAAVSKLLHSPAGVRLLTRGMRIPVANKAASAAWLTELAAATSPSGSQSLAGAPAR